MKSYWCSECLKSFKTEFSDFHQAPDFQDILCPFCDSLMIYEKNQLINVLRPLSEFKNQEAVLIKCNYDMLDDLKNDDNWYDADD